MVSGQMGVIGAVVLPVLLIVLLAYFRRSIVKAVVFVTEILVLLLIFIFTVAGAGAGYLFLSDVYAMIHPHAQVAAGFLGGLIGFVISSLLAFFVLTLAQIERNTRR
jgi:hypothetical protein